MGKDAFAEGGSHQWSSRKRITIKWPLLVMNMWRICDYTLQFLLIAVIVLHFLPNMLELSFQLLMNFCLSCGTFHLIFLLAYNQNQDKGLLLLSFQILYYIPFQDARYFPSIHILSTKQLHPFLKYRWSLHSSEDAMDADKRKNFAPSASMHISSTITCPSIKRGRPLASEKVCRWKKVFSLAYCYSFLTGGFYWKACIIAIRVRAQRLLLTLESREN